MWSSAPFGWPVAESPVGSSRLERQYRADIGCGGRASLRNALYHWARTSVQHDCRSSEHYARLRAAGHSHGRALRGVADRLLTVLIAMLKAGQPYDPMLRPTPSRASKNSAEGLPFTFYSVPWCIGSERSRPRRRRARASLDRFRPNALLMIEEGEGSSLYARPDRPSLTYGSTSDSHGGVKAYASSSLTLTNGWGVQFPGS